jgi:hypothetical protein
MKTIIAPLAALAALGLSVSTASAASPAYCALYAKEFLKHAAVDSQGSLPPTLIHDRAYHKCLNLDDEPLLPTAYSDPTIDGVGGPFAVEEGSAEIVVDNPTVEATAVKASVVETTAALEADPAPVRKRTGKWSGSGFAMWSPEWKSWCAEHFPKSFDPATGTIIPLKTGKRTECR